MKFAQVESSAGPSIHIEAHREKVLPSYSLTSPLCRVIQLMICPLGFSQDITHLLIFMIKNFSMHRRVPLILPDSTIMSACSFPFIFLSFIHCREKGGAGGRREIKSIQPDIFCDGVTLLIFQGRLKQFARLINMGQ